MIGPAPLGRGADHQTFRHLLSGRAQFTMDAGGFVPLAEIFDPAP
jgi:hypothetical protein